MMLLVVLSCCLVAATAQIMPPVPDNGMQPNMTHHHGNGTGHHHENPEKELWSFNFEPSSGMMVVVKNDECFLWRITSDERSKIHTDAGLRSVEIRVVGEIQNAVYTVIDGVILNTHILRSCGNHAKKYFLVH